MEPLPQRAHRDDTGTGTAPNETLGPTPHYTVDDVDLALLGPGIEHRHRPREHGIPFALASDREHDELPGPDDCCDLGRPHAQEPVAVADVPVLDDGGLAKRGRRNSSLLRTRKNEEPTGHARHRSLPDGETRHAHSSKPDVSLSSSTSEAASTSAPLAIARTLVHSVGTWLSPLALGTNSSAVGTTRATNWES